MLIGFGPFPTLSSAPYPTPSHPHPHFPRPSQWILRRVGSGLRGACVRPRAVRAGRAAHAYASRCRTARSAAGRFVNRDPAITLLCVQVSTAHLRPLLTPTIFLIHFPSHVHSGPLALPTHPPAAAHLRLTLPGLPCTAVRPQPWMRAVVRC